MAHWVGDLDAVDSTDVSANPVYLNDGDLDAFVANTLNQVSRVWLNESLNKSLKVYLPKVEK